MLDVKNFDKQECLVTAERIKNMTIQEKIDELRERINQELSNLKREINAPINKAEQRNVFKKVPKYPPTPDNAKDRKPMHSISLICECGQEFTNDSGPFYAQFTCINCGREFSVSITERKLTDEQIMWSRIHEYVCAVGPGAENCKAIYLIMKYE